MKKLLLFLGVVVLVLVISAFILKDTLAKSIIRKEMSTLGMPVYIEKLTVSLFKTAILVNNLTIYNPEGFKENIMAEIQELFIDFDLTSLLKKSVHFSEIRLNLSKLYIEKTSEGRINIDELKIKEEEKPTAELKYQIDKLVLTLGHVKAADYSRRMIPSIIETDMRIKDEVFKNVTDIGEIANIVINKIIANHLFLGLGIAAEGMAEIGLEGAGIVGKGAAEIAETILPFGKK